MVWVLGPNNNEALPCDDGIRAWLSDAVVPHPDGHTDAAHPLHVRSSLCCCFEDLVKKLMTRGV